ncbi:MAG: hypothetical protein J1G01_00210 [Clostridiales bacterium]|nr:hypothetical protein [Clostridiales bacterium]
MQHSAKRTIENIILINQFIYGLQDRIEREQEAVIADTVSPAKKIVEKLIELDNKRIDLCNLKVLYGFIERGLGDKFEILRSCAFGGTNCGLYDLAVRQIELADYSVKRANDEFSYLFKLIKRKPKIKKVLPNYEFVMGNA